MWGWTWVAILAGASWMADAGEALAAQDSTSDRLRVYLDCDRCDFDYVRREVPYVNHVRDPNDAQVHVLVTRRQTGAGGREYRFYFLGRGDYAGRSDTVRFVARQDATDDEIREGQVRTYALGLVPYLLGTPLADRMALSVSGAPAATVVPEHDPWKRWVFELRAGGALDGEQRTEQVTVNGSVSASRVTNQWKIDLSAFGRFERERFDLSSGERVVSTTKNVDAGAVIVRSIGPHWSVGARGAATASTRVNQDLTLRAAPALEYSVYPYAESSRRQITMLYSVGLVRYDYEQITLFDRLDELRARQRLEVSAEFRQPWGSLNLSLSGSTFLHDVSRHRLDLFSNVEVRLFRGLGLDVRGSVARIKDQIYLPRADVSDQDILLERRQLGTDVEYSLDLGVSFFFGSIFNDVVNPRMGELGGRRRFF